MSNKNLDESAAKLQELKHVAMSYHKTLLNYCDRLEKIADALPDMIDKQECLVIARQIYPVICKAHRFEEQELFPVLNASQNPNDATPKNLERLQFEHWEDESFAEEVSEALQTYVLNTDKVFSDKLGYMLRGLFEGLRRHIAFEAEFLLPKLQA